MGLGTHKPHLTWEYPRPFFDAIAADVAEAKHRAWPAAAPHLAVRRSRTNEQRPRASRLLCLTRFGP